MKPSLYLKQKIFGSHKIWKIYPFKILCIQILLIYAWKVVFHLARIIVEVFNFSDLSFELHFSNICNLSELIICPYFTCEVGTTVRIRAKADFFLVLQSFVWKNRLFLTKFVRINYCRIILYRVRLQTLVQ